MGMMQCGASGIWTPLIAACLLGGGEGKTKSMESMQQVTKMAHISNKCKDDDDEGDGCFVQSLCGQCSLHVRYSTAQRERVLLSSRHVGGYQKGYKNPIPMIWIRNHMAS